MIIESKGEICPRLHALGVPDLPAYLLMGRLPALFDGGITIVGPLYIEGLRNLLGDEKNLVYNLLTHSHFDHAGTTPYLKRKIPDLKIGSHALAADNLRKPGAVSLIKSLCAEFEVKYKDLIGEEDVSFQEIMVDMILADGMKIDLGDGLTVEVMATPGHTRDTLSYYIPTYRALITGEAVGVFDKNYAIQPEFLTSYKDYMNSLTRLSTLDVDVLMMSHYFTLTGDDARTFIPRSIKTTKAFRRRIENLLADCHGDRKAVVERIYQEDFVGTGAVMQEARPYLLNLQAKVRCVAEDR